MMSGGRYRVLMASMWLPAAPTGGAARRFELARRLAERCDVTLFGGALSGDPSYVRALTAAGVDVRETPWDNRAFSARQQQRHWRAKLATTRHSLGSIKPGQQYWQDASMPGGPAALRQLAVDGRFDIIHVETSLAHWFQGVTLPAPFVVDFMDINSVLLRRQADVQDKERRRLLLLLESYKMRRYERAAAARADVCTTTSTMDSAILRSLRADARTFEAPNGVDTRYFQPAPAGSSGEDSAGPTLLFTGTMGYQPNVDAMRYFATRVFPQVRASVPAARLLIVGASPAPDVQALTSISGIQVVGTVPDVRPYFARATVVIVPLRIGSGTRLKILEALAMEKAVVTTPVGAEGLDLGAGEIVEAGVPTDFADAVIALLSDPDRRKRLGAAGRASVVARYDWDASADKLYRLYSALAEKRPLPGADEPAPRVQHVY